MKVDVLGLGMLGCMRRCFDLLAEHEALRADAPAGVLEMLRIPGLSPRKVRQIHQVLGIGNLADLESACHDGRVRTAKGLGPGLETKT